MFWIGLAVLVPYLALYLFDLQRRAQRRVPRREARRRLGVTALHAVTLGYLCYLPPAAWWWPFYAVLVLANIGLRLLADSEPDAVVEGPERFRQGLIQTLQAPLWILVATLWEFIDGAGMMLRLVLPVSMRDLRPLCEGAAATWTLIFLVQAVFLLRAKPAGVELPAPATLPAAEEASTDLSKAS